MPEYKLPDVGEGLTEAEIVAWHVKVGDVVSINQIVVEIETAKSIVELPSPYEGEVSAILVEVGETVPVGTPIIAIGEPVASAGEPVATPEAPVEIDLSNPAASGGGEGESLVGRNKADRGPVRRARRRPGAEAAGIHTARADVHDVFNQGATGQHEAVERIVDTVLHDAEEQARAAGRPTSPEPTPTPAEPVGSEVRMLAKPPVRKLAKDLGVDLARLTPTGPHGTVSREDVQAAVGAEAAGVSTSSTSGERERREPIKGVRKMMGQAMVQSAFTLPHVTEWVTVDVTRTMELVERLKSRRDLRDARISPLLVLARAVMLAMRRTPEINSWWDDAAQEVVYKSYVNLGIAAATPRGLVVPNVKDAEAMSLPELASAVGELVDTARAGKTQPADMSGGTFTITNVGPFGVDGGTPIINPGESAILCFGAIKRQPWVVGAPGEESVVPRDVCTLALAFDHRHIDGELGSRFLSDVAGILEDPGTALLY